MILVFKMNQLMGLNELEVKFMKKKESPCQLPACPTSWAGWSREGGSWLLYSYKQYFTHVLA
jgi:hypothetical protein